MKRPASLTIQLLLAIFFGSVLATNLNAQISLPMTVTIPFPFTLDKQEMTPGTYKLSLVSDPLLLSIVNLKNGHEKFFAVSRDYQTSIESRGRLLFHPADGSKQLYEMYFPGSGLWINVLEHRPAQGSEDRARSSNALTARDGR